MELDEQSLRKTVGKNISLYRKARKDTQAALGQKLNYSDKAVSKWERGESLPDVYVLTRIADLYGITVGNLIGETKPEIRVSPYLRLFVLLLSCALIFLIGTILIVTFELLHVPFNTWLFLLYAAALSAVTAVVFTSIWRNHWWQLGAWSAAIWLTGLSVLLTIPGNTAAKGLLICAAFQILVTFWLLYRRSRLTKKDPEEETT